MRLPVSASAEKQLESHLLLIRLGAFSYMSVHQVARRLCFTPHMLLFPNAHTMDSSLSTSGEGGMCGREASSLFDVARYLLGLVRLPAVWMARRGKVGRRGGTWSQRERRGTRRFRGSWRRHWLWRPHPVMLTGRRCPSRLGGGDGRQAVRDTVENLPT